MRAMLIVGLNSGLMDDREDGEIAGWTKELKDNS